ncbi:MAG: agmatine deiminase family protein [Muribaculaceae bacterium]|nr:agmatine deiminase family protein [Muribaculaceae bacterium]
MNIQRSFFTLLVFASMMSSVGCMNAQAQTKEAPDWRKLHYLSEEEMKTPVRSLDRSFKATPAPTEAPRFVAEFEPMQGVMIRYPLGIPVALVKSLAENCQVYCIVQSSSQSSARSAFTNAGVNMNRVTFVNAKSDSYWVRDYGPWYIFAGKSPAIVDNVYNRPRQNDDAIPSAFATHFSIPLYSMNLVHTGGNMMEDGRGHAVSDELILQENNNDEDYVRQQMLAYLGIDNYHITIDPQGEYIAHVDCWGKYLAPDKILIAKLPQSNSRYEYYEAVANYFATTNCCWGYPYKVYRVEEPGGNTVAPYTNSLILNKHVYVPMGSNSTYNEKALQVYREAMPGYEVEGVYNSSYSIQWLNTDALHCRTRGVMDFDMLFVDHRDVLHGTQDCQDSIAVTSKFIAYSGKPLKEDSLLVYYSIDGGPYQVAHMTATGAPDEYVGYIKGYHQASEVDYYVYGADESGHSYQQPVFGELDPHHFTVNITFVRGDVNMDGKVNIDDVTTLIDYLLGTAVSPFSAAAADVDQDSRISIDDVTALIDMILMS